MIHKEDIMKYWPLATVIACGCVAWGSLQAEVADLKEKATAALTDHDRLVRMEEQQKSTKDSVDEIKTIVKEIARQQPPREHP